LIARRPFAQVLLGGRAMLEQMSKSAATLLVVCALLSGCARFSQTGRSQAAYAKYVRKMSHNRVKMQTKFKKVKTPKASIPRDVVNAGTVTDGPQSVSTNSSN
jgi:hypothetical protein